MGQKTLRQEALNGALDMPQQRLPRTKEQWRAIFDVVGIGMVLTDRTGTVLEVNRHFLDIVGYTAEELFGKEWPEITHPEDIPGERASFKELLRSRKSSLTLEKRYIGKDGGTVWCHITGSVVRDHRNKVQFIVVVIQDISERKLAEERFLAIFEGVGIGIGLINPSGKVMETNRFFQEMLGYSAQELVGVDWRHLTHPDDVEREEKTLNEMLKRGDDLLVFEKRYVRKDGDVVWARLTGTLMRDPNGEPNHLIVAAQDITGRKLAEERFKSIFEGSAIAMVLTDLDGRTVESNRAAQQMLGYDAEEFKGVRLSQYTHPDDLLVELPLWRDLRKGTRDRIEIEKRFVRKDGTMVWCNLAGSLLRSEDGGGMFFLGAAQDITERKRAEKKLLKYQEQLKHLASELSLAEERERRELATEIHDRVTQNLSLARMELRALRSSMDSRALQEELGEISGLIEDAIKESRALIMELSPPVLSELGFEAALEWLADRTSEQCGVQVTLDNDHRPKPLDHDLKGVLFKAMGELMMNISKHSKAKNVRISVLRDEGSIRLQVEDDGVGFRVDEVSNRYPQESGFGLFSIRERLKLHGGEFRIESEPGNGTNATLLAPLRAE